LKLRKLGKQEKKKENIRRKASGTKRICRKKNLRLENGDKNLGA
jgi:hypothetical protein